MTGRAGLRGRQPLCPTGRSASGPAALPPPARSGPRARSPEQPLPEHRRPQRWRAPPCPPGIAVRRFPCARPERSLLRAGVWFRSGFFFGGFVFWGTFFCRFPPILLASPWDCIGDCEGKARPCLCPRPRLAGLMRGRASGVPPPAALCTGPGARLGPAAELGRKGTDVYAGKQGLL